MVRGEGAGPGPGAPGAGRRSAARLGGSVLREGGFRRDRKCVKLDFSRFLCIFPFAAVFEDLKVFLWLPCVCGRVICGGAQEKRQLLGDHLSMSPT